MKLGYHEVYDNRRYKFWKVDGWLEFLMAVRNLLESEAMQFDR
jgi:hypothetical protein